MTTTVPARILRAADCAPLDALLAGWGLPAAYARSHLREYGLVYDTVRAVGCYSEADPSALDAALVAHDGIGWTLWHEPDHAAALVGALPSLGPTLLSGPQPLVEPLLAHFPTERLGGVDRCPFERLAPGDFRMPAGTQGAGPGRAPLPRRAALDD